jgi:CubicO group peptidase (beta-lactamase class C family)
LSHTAGLPNPIPLRWVHPVQEHTTFDEGAALRTVLSKHRGLVARPGTRFAYSNIGYWLLGALVEQVTRESFPSYVTNRLLVPLGLPLAGMAYVIADPGRHATGYLERFSVLNLIKPLLLDPRLIAGPISRWVAVRPHYADGPAFGGLIGTASAFGIFLQDQLRAESKLLGPVARARFVERQRTEHDVIPMTLGWHVASKGPHAHLFKEGAGGGFHSMMRLYPNHGIGTVLMANATTVNIRRVLDSLDAPLLSLMS